MAPEIYTPAMDTTTYPPIPMKHGFPVGVTLYVKGKGVYRATSPTELARLPINRHERRAREAVARRRRFRPDVKAA